MRISIEDATDLVAGAFRKVGYDERQAAIVTEHIIGCELRGVAIGGLSRALSLIERIQSGDPPQPIRIVRETPSSALIDGGNDNGYLVAHRAAEIGIAKAKSTGIAIVGASNTWYSGMYAQYMEMATREGLVAMAAGSSAPRVAPHGSSQGRFGTNPIAFGFPSEGDPVIFDIGTSVIMVGDLALKMRLGEPLNPGEAYDAEGRETLDPAAALRGAIRVWGGHKGSGLAIVVQLLGIMVGGGAMPEDYKDCGFLFLALRPDLFGETGAFERAVSDYADTVRAARPLDPSRPVRMPFDRSAEARRRHLAEGAIDVPEKIQTALRAIAEGRA